jgi:CheY-like chemotaxis protein
MPGKKFQILCVDDHEDTCLMLSILFGQLGYEAETMCDPDDALARAREGRFDLYVLDGRFHGLERTDLCASILSLNPRARVVFYSGAAQDSDRERAMRAGATAYVAKPDIKALVAVVNDVLTRGSGDAT